MGAVNVTESAGQLGGTLNINDRVPGLVLTGVTESGGYTAGTPILVTSLTDVATAGITVANNPFALKHLTDFYAAAPLGSQLYLMLVPNTMTVASMADNTNASGAKKLLDFANGKIKVLIVASDDKTIAAVPITVTVTNGLNALCYTAATNMKTMETAYRSAQKPFRGIVGGTSYSGVPSALTDQSSGTTNNKCAIFIGDTRSYDATNCDACVGLLAGWIANCAVQEKISKVLKGSLPITAAYLKTTTLELAGNDPATIAGKNYITLTSYPNRAGYYFSGDPMLCASTDDYWFLARGRVIDKAHVIAYNTFVDEVDDDVPTVTGGLIDPAFAKSLETRIVNQLNLTMTNQGEISAADCFIDPNQNVISTPTLNVVLKVRPKGYLTTINVALGFEL